MKIGNFKVENFLKYDKTPNPFTLVKIGNIINELNEVRNVINEPIYITSGSRTVTHELAYGRNGNSQHVYDNGLGAVDISSRDLDGLFEVLVMYSKFTRICMYKEKRFIHCDFLPSNIREFKAINDTWHIY